jgi:AraC-like DNA-binding protein
VEVERLRTDGRAPTTIDVSSVDEDGPVTIYASDAVTVGRFRCGPDDARWQEINCIGADHHIVFPETAVAIEPIGQASFVTNRNHVVFYNPDQEFRRRLVAGDGDRCWYLIVRSDEVGRMVWSATGGAACDGRFPIADAMSTTEHFIAHRRLIDRALRALETDPLEVEETALVCAAGVLESAVGTWTHVEGPLTDRQRRAVEAVKMLLSVRFVDRLTMADIGGSVGMSPFHLARVFRRATGQSVHAYRTGLRVRTAVDRIRSGATDLAAVAVDVGFASHSHLTDSFRRLLGTTPSAIRGDAPTRPA